MEKIFLGALAVAALLTIQVPCALADPPVLVETDKILASDLGSSHEFGYAVDIDGGTLVVGSRFDSAYVFERDGDNPGQWIETKILVASDGAVNNSFGQAVSISGNTIAIGAATDSDGGCGASACGAVYIYERSQGGADNWGEIKKIRASDLGVNDQFGRSVDLDEDTLAVGSPANGLAGAVYIFERSLVGPLWGEAKKITPSDAGPPGQVFGGSVSLDSDTLLVGSIGGSIQNAGYIFGRDRDGTENWGEIERIRGADVDGTTSFATSVSISGNLAIVGAPRDDGVCAPMSDCNAGAVYLFERNTGGAENWGEVLKLTASDFSTGAQFGGSVAVAPGALIIGAASDIEDGVRSGAAYLFLQGQGGPSDWIEAAKLQASDRDVDDLFGFTVATDGPSAVIGVPGDRDICCSSGAAYVFDLPDSPVLIFEDGFESGQTSAWSLVVGEALLNRR